MNSCKNCALADNEVEMLTPNAVYCKHWQKGVWSHDKTGRACFESKE